MKNMSDTVRITHAMSAWEWSLISDALDAYGIEHMDEMDMSAVIEFADHIDARIGIKNFDD